MSELTPSENMTPALDVVLAGRPVAEAEGRSIQDRSVSKGVRVNRRIEGLDGLRGLAALGVLAFHFTSNYQGFFGFQGSPPFFFQHGMYGVQLFFLISGFVIFMTVERTKRPTDFAIARVCRLYPAFWLSLLICIVVMAATDGPGPFIGWGRLLRRFALGATMIPGWFHVGSLSGVYWTLEIEMGFYVIIFALLVARRIEWTVPVLGLLVAVGVVDGLYSRYHPNPVSPWLQTAYFLPNIHYLLIGVLLYKVRKEPKPVYFLIMLACFFVTYSQDPKRHEPLRDTIVIAVITAVVWLATSGRIPLLSWTPFVFLGSISYSLYLNHSMMGEHIIYNAERAGISAAGAILLATVASLVLATAITKLFEEPMTAALKRRFRRAD